MATSIRGTEIETQSSVLDRFSTLKLSVAWLKPFRLALPQGRLLAEGSRFYSSLRRRRCDVLGSYCGHTMGSIPDRRPSQALAPGPAWEAERLSDRPPQPVRRPSNATLVATLLPGAPIGFDAEGCARTMSHNSSLAPKVASRAVRKLGRRARSTSGVWRQSSQS